MNWSFTPNYIRQTEAQVALGTVTAERWNELWNLNITQGDHSEIALNTLINTSLPAFEAELKAYADLYKTGDASNITVEYTEAASKTALASGEKLSVALGKIKKWFSSLGSAAFTDASAYDASGAASGAVSTHNAAGDAHSTLFANKANKKVPAVANNVALLDANGNLADSGKAFTPAGIGAATTAYVDSAIGAIASSINTINGEDV